MQGNKCKKVENGQKRFQKITSRDIDEKECWNLIGPKTHLTNSQPKVVVLMLPSLDN